MKKLAVLAGSLAFALVLSVAAPALAQEEPMDGPAPKVGSVTAPEDQYEDVSSDLTILPASTVDCNPQAFPQAVPQATPQDMLDESSTTAAPGGNGNPCTPETNTGNTNLDPACARCGVQVARAAQEAITGGDSDTGPSPTETFGVALQAARDAGSSATRDAAASEEGQQGSAPVEDTPAYQAAFEAAKEAGADEETAKETAIEAVADLLPDEAVGSASSESSTSEASKSSKGGSGEGIAATEGKTSKGDASKGDASKDRKDKPHEDDASEEENADEEATEDTDEEIVASGEDGGSGDVPSTPAESKAPLLLGGVALLSVGGFAALGLARSWPPSSARGRRLLRN